MLPLFRSDIFVKENVGTEEQREDLKKQILHAKENDMKTAPHSNDGCWRSDARYDCEWLNNAIYKLSDEANKVYFEGDPTYKKFLEKCTNRDSSYWTNVNEVGSSNVIHSHKPDAWSGIYYVQAEGTGNLMFTNPANILSDCNHTSPFTRKVGLEPRDGMLVIWPGWVPHEVEENKSAQQRINLAWGVNFK